VHFEKEEIDMKNPPIDICTHVPGTPKGEEWTSKKGKQEAGREGDVRTARYSTSVDPKRHGPIDPRMPHMPPA
jgi:hypothetical protein